MVPKKDVLVFKQFWELCPCIVNFDPWERGLIGNSQLCVTNSSSSKLPDI